MDVYEKIKESRNTLSPFCQRLGIVVCLLYTSDAADE